MGATRMKARGMGMVLAGVALAGSLVGCGVNVSAGAPGPVRAVPTADIAKGVSAAATPASGSENRVIVMTVGSSVAAGWGDAPGAGGYLARAFESLSHRQGVHYQILSWAIPGMTVVDAAKHFKDWLSHAKPNLVVISWGGLDDAVAHTPVIVFANAVRTEIRESLAAHAAVFVVTPPVTPAAYLNGVNQTPYLYFQAEIAVARSFHNPNVQVFDVYDQMLNVMKAKGLPYTRFMADGWHPNALGHALAGRLLAGDVVGQYGRQAVGILPPKTPPPIAKGPASAI